MKVHSIVLNSCLAISAGCLGAGYISGGYWLILPAFLVMAVFWIAMKKRPVFWPASGLLLIHVVLSIIGVTLNLSIYLMICGCAAALASWDLAHFREGIAGNPPLETDAPLTRNRLQSLAMAVFSGLLLAVTSSNINLQFPFGITVLLVLMLMGGLVHGLGAILKNR